MDHALGPRFGFHQQVLDAMDQQVALIDAAGDIAAVNSAWIGFCAANGGDPDVWSVGANYIAVCWRAQQGMDADAARAYAGIGDVLAGRRGRFSMEYPCHSPRVQRWFLMTVTPLRDGERVHGAVIAHRDISRTRQRGRSRAARIAASA